MGKPRLLEITDTKTYEPCDVISREWFEKMLNKLGLFLRISYNPDRLVKGFPTFQACVVNDEETALTDGMWMKTEEDAIKTLINWVVMDSVGSLHPIAQAEKRNEEFEQSLSDYINPNKEKDDA